eukprot:3180826-Pyramimonas_sp.AAC.1
MYELSAPLLAGVVGAACESNIKSIRYILPLDSMGAITGRPRSGQVRNSRPRALNTRAAVSVTWTDEMCVVVLGGVLHLLDMQPTLFSFQTHQPYRKVPRQHTLGTPSAGS